MREKQQTASNFTQLKDAAQCLHQCFQCCNCVLILVKWLNLQLSCSDFWQKTVFLVVASATTPSSSISVLHSCFGVSHPARTPVLLQALRHIPASGPWRRPLVVSTCNFVNSLYIFFSVYVSSFIWFYFDIQLLLMRDLTKVTFLRWFAKLFVSAFVCGSGFLRQAKPRRRAERKDDETDSALQQQRCCLVCWCVRQLQTGVACELCRHSSAARCCTWQTCTCK